MLESWRIAPSLNVEYTLSLEHENDYERPDRTRGVAPRAGRSRLPHLVEQEDERVAQGRRPLDDGSRRRHPLLHAGAGDATAGQHLWAVRLPPRRGWLLLPPASRHGTDRSLGVDDEEGGRQQTMDCHASWIRRQGDALVLPCHGRRRHRVPHALMDEGRRVV